MRDFETDRALGKVLAIGAAFTTVFLLSGANTDPVNVTKLFAGGISAVASGAILLVFNLRTLVRFHKITLVLSILFFCALLNSTLNSGAPVSQAFYGTYGRNTGSLTYIFLLLVLLSSITLLTHNSIKFSTYSILFAGTINILYCGLVLLFGDFIGWHNPYGNILGLFGNPDFISAFLGMFIAGAFSFALQDELKPIRRIFLILLSLIAFVEIIKSHAIQGIVVTVGGIGIVIFFKLRSRFSTWFFPSIYIAATAILGILSIFGALQKGPFTFLYKRSVSLRGTYWHTGINMGMERPWTGVGMDTYGDWYRRMRPPIALIDTPGISTNSNVAHNVVIDFFAFGGWPLLLSYLALILVGLVAIFKVILRTRSYDPIFVALASIWLCYQVQSIISINQVGLAIWGWLFTGLLVAYERNDKVGGLVNSENSPRKKRKKAPETTSVITPGLVAGIGALVGALIAVPPLSSDMKWLKSINSRNAQQVESSLVVTYMNPANSFKYAQAVQLFQSSNLLEQAHKYALAAVKFNPDYFDGWKQIYYLPNATDSERKLALEKLTRLDPKNPDPTKNYD